VTRVTSFEGNDMSTKDVHAGPPRAQNFHPEFGYFCPSKQLRRKVRSGAMTAGAVMLIVVGTALALVPQLAPQSRDGTREESALTATAPSPTVKSAGLVEGVDLGPVDNLPNRILPLGDSHDDSGLI
jgi:hypothetical protein